MRRFALMVAALAILGVSAGQAQAHGHHGHYGHHGYYTPAVVYPRVWAPPVVVMPPRVYPPVYDYRYYTPRPASGFYYRGPGVSVGVGF